MRTRGLRAVLALAAGLVLLGAASPVWAGDVDGDGVDDAIDVCNNTPPGTAVDAEGRPLGDIDQDCDTDLEDYALFVQGFTGPLAPPVVIDTVPVGNPGNAADTRYETPGFGGVDYTYNIGKYEVTVGQYCEFLNAVANTDTYGLYNFAMWWTPYGCKILQSGSAGSYEYSVAGDYANRPVNYVSWGDAARFANWLHNGQPSGAQGLSTTEDGAYYLNGAMTDAELMGVNREADWTWAITNEDEWYKAAYYNPGSSSYYDYPTSSNSVPGRDMTETTNPGNNANYYHHGVLFPIDSPYYTTVAGEFELSDSPYGTFDQGGNVWEWHEAVLYGSARGVRGGSFDGSGFFTYFLNLHASNRNNFFYPTYENYHVGFRVAEVP